MKKLKVRVQKSAGKMKPDEILQSKGYKKTPLADRFGYAFDRRTAGNVCVRLVVTLGTDVEIKVAQLKEPVTQTSCLLDKEEINALADMVNEN